MNFGKTLLLACGLFFCIPGLTALRCDQVFAGETGVHRALLSIDRQFSRAVQALENHQYKQAYDLSIIILRLQPSHLGNLWVLGESLVKMGRYQEAALAFEKSAQISLAPKQEYIRLLDVYKKVRDPESFLGTLLRLNEIEGDTPRGLNMILNNQVELGRIREAEETFIKLAQIETNPIMILKARVRVEMARGDHQKAVEAIESFQAKNPQLQDSGVLGAKAKAQAQLGQVRRAIETYRAILKFDPENPIALSQAAHLLILRGEFAQAYPLLEKVLKVEPYNHVARWNQVVAMLGMERTDLLKNQIADMVSGPMKDLSQGALRIAEERFPEALVSLDKIKEPSIVVLTLKAQAQYEMGRIDRAYKTLMDIVRVSPRVNYQAIAGLIRIERHEHGSNNFEASPALETIIKSLSPREVEMVLKTSKGNVWSHVEQWAEVADPAYHNSFWTSLTHTAPVDGQAVKILKSP